MVIQKFGEASLYPEKVSRTRITYLVGTVGTVGTTLYSCGFFCSDSVPTVPTFGETHA